MANDFILPPVPPNPNRFGPGQKLLAETEGCFRDLGRAFNWAHAWGGSQNVISQGWDNSIATTTAVMPGAGTWHGQWRIFELGSAWTSVRCQIRAEYAGAANGQVRFQSAVGGGTLTLNVNPGAAAWYSGTLSPLDLSLGYEEIRLTIAGDGADATTLHEVMVDYVPLTSPLAAAGTDGTTPLDAAEIDADSVGSSDVGIYMRNNLRALFGDAADLANYPGRRRSYYQWTDLDGIQTGMHDTEHRVHFPVHYGAVAEGYTLTVYVMVTAGVGDTYVYLYHNAERAGHPGTARETTRITVPAGADGWYTTTVALDDRYQALRNMPHPFSYMSIWPGTRDYAGVGNFGPGVRQQNDGDTGPTIRAVSAWGY